MRTIPSSLERLESRLAPATFTIMNLNDSGAGSLREAIDAANLDVATADTIVFSHAAGTGTIALVSTIQITVFPSLLISRLVSFSESLDVRDNHRLSSFPLDPVVAALASCWTTEDRFKRQIEEPSRPFHQHRGVLLRLHFAAFLDESVAQILMLLPRGRGEPSVKGVRFSRPGAASATRVWSY